jgi:putative FmdB family regulatory protein
MPLFEYVCRDCGHGFEAFVTSERPPSCPSCHGRVLEKQFSVFAVSTTSREATPTAAPCGTCGDPRGPGSCSLN